MKTLVMIAPLATQVKAARALGAMVVTIWDDEISEKFYPGLAAESEEIADLALRCDFSAPRFLMETLRLHRASLGEDFILFFSGRDPYFKVYAHVAEALGQLKNTQATIDLFANKSGMRRAMEGSSLEISAQVANTFDSLNLILRNRRGPVIVKPCVSFASKDVELVVTRADELRVIAKWNQIPIFEVLVEEYFEEPQFSVEAITSQGQHHILGITEKYPVLPPHFVENGGVFPAQISNDDQALLAAATCELLKIASVQDGPTHTEFILSRGRAVLIESHLRQGGIIPFMMEAALGFSIIDLSIQNALGLLVNPIATRNHVSLLGMLEFECGRVLERLSGREALKVLPYVVTHNVWALLGQRLKKPTCNLSRHGYVIVVGENLIAAQANLELARATLVPQYGIELLQDGQAPS